MKTVKTMLKNKSSEIWTISQNATVYSAIQKMSDRRIGALPVVDEEKLVGIISERDYARRVILAGKSSKETKIKDVMTDALFYVSMETSVDQCMALMTEKRIRHLPIMDRGKLIGILSIGDIIKEIMTEQKIMIKHLEDYIMR